MDQPTEFQKLLYEKYKGIVLAGIMLTAFAVWLYEYFYSTTGDDLIGLFSAAFLFLGVMTLGNGIRGWRDGDDWRYRYIEMNSRGGAHLTIKKRKKKMF